MIMMTMMNNFSITIPKPNCCARERNSAKIELETFNRRQILAMIHEARTKEGHKHDYMVHNLACLVEALYKPA